MTSGYYYAVKKNIYIIRGSGMDEKKYLKILIVRAKESIVTRGIEKRLTDENHHVEHYFDRPEDVEPSIPGADVIILYLSDGLRPNQGEFLNIATILHDMKLAGKRAVMIGEERDREPLMNSLKDMRGCIWVNRPLDMDAFVKIVEDPKTRALATEPSILIVDDDPTFAKMIREWLKEYYKVSVVTAGMQAITFLMKNDVDLILLDYEMPIVDGPQVLEMLKSDQTTSEIPVMFLTNKSDRKSIMKVIALKPAKYLLKTMKPFELVAAIDEFFEKKDAPVESGIPIRRE